MISFFVRSSYQIVFCYTNWLTTFIFLMILSIFLGRTISSFFSLLSCRVCCLNVLYIIITCCIKISVFGNEVTKYGYLSCREDFFPSFLLHFFKGENLIFFTFFLGVCNVLVWILKWKFFVAYIKGDMTCFRLDFIFFHFHLIFVDFLIVWVCVWFF